MARKPKERKVPIVNKEYLWDLDVDGDIRTFKVFVGENECITYEDDVECKHLKIMDKRQMQGVLQIDCETKVFGDMTPFQLENGIPYLKLENEDGDLKWTMSDTTKEDRLVQQIHNLKKEAYMYAGIGLIFTLVTLVVQLTVGLGEWSMLPIIGIMCFTAAGLQLVRLKNELEAMGRKFSWKL